MRCPFNYMGSKHAILEQLLPLFPPHVTEMYDLFAGGGSIGVSTSCDQVHFNDLNRDQIGLLHHLYDTPTDLFIQTVKSVITKYGLSDTSQYGYGYYGGDSGVGLAWYNKEPYTRLRADFNTKKQHGFCDYAELYTLLVFAFNNQIRFNSSTGAFNTPVGKRDFNHSMQTKLVTYMQQLKTKKATFTSLDFRDCIEKLLRVTEGHSSRAFVYCDPPYLITTATYNEQQGWTDQDEQQLLNALDQLDRRGIYFGLSNVTHDAGKTNTLLLDWLNQHSYSVYDIKKSYKNSNYQKNSTRGETKEVYITNYNNGEI